MAKLHFKNVNKIYPNNVQAVFDFNLDIDDKEFVVFVGPSGCGKSTTLRMVAGLEEISSGEIYIDDVLINDVPAKNRNIAMVFQNYALYPHMTVFENMAFSLQLRKDLFPVYEIKDQEGFDKAVNDIYDEYAKKEADGVADLKTKKATKDEIKDFVYRTRLARDFDVSKAREKFEVRVMTYDHDKVAELEKDLKNTENLEEKAEISAKIEKVRSELNKPAFEYRKYSKQEITAKVVAVAETIGLEQYLKRKPGALSGGQRQRVALGRAIVRNPKVFLMDEPLSNLDAKLRVQMRTEISKLYQDLGVTVIYVTHDQTEAMTMATKIVCMKDGRIQQIGTPKELFNTPANLFVAGFIGSPAMNFINGTFDGKNFVFEECDVKIKLNKNHIDLLKNYEGKEIVLGVRPENILFTNDKTREHLSNPFKLTCDICELLGHELILYNYIGNLRLVVKTTAVDEMKHDEACEYVLDMDRIHFFDKDTTERIK